MMSPAKGPVMCKEVRKRTIVIPNTQFHVMIARWREGWRFGLGRRAFLKVMLKVTPSEFRPVHNLAFVPFSVAPRPRPI